MSLGVDTQAARTIPSDLKSLDGNLEAQYEEFNKLLESVGSEGAKDTKKQAQLVHQALRLVSAFASQNPKLVENLLSRLTNGNLGLGDLAKGFALLTKGEMANLKGIEKLAQFFPNVSGGNKTTNVAAGNSADLISPTKFSGPSLDIPIKAVGTPLANVLAALKGLNSNSALVIFTLILLKEIQEQVRDTNLQRAELQAQLAFDAKVAQAATIKKEAMINLISAAVGLAFSAANFGLSTKQLKQQNALHNDAKLNRQDIRNNEKLLDGNKGFFQKNIAKTNRQEIELKDQLGDRYNANFKSKELKEYEAANTELQNIKAQKNEAKQKAVAENPKGDKATLLAEVDSNFKAREDAAYSRLNKTKKKYFGGTVETAHGPRTQDGFAPVEKTKIKSAVERQQDKVDALRANPNTDKATLQAEVDELNHLKLERVGQEKREFTRSLDTIKDKGHELQEIGKSLDLKLSQIQSQTQLRNTLFQAINGAISTGFNYLSGSYRAEGAILEGIASLENHYAQVLRTLEQSAASQSGDLRNLIGQIFAATDNAVKNLQRIRG